MKVTSCPPGRRDDAISLASSVGSCLPAALDQPG
jgi:hypothetical protein